MKKMKIVGWHIKNAAPPKGIEKRQRATEEIKGHTWGKLVKKSVAIKIEKNKSG